MNQTLAASAVGIIDVIRDEQTRVCVEAHAPLITLLLPRQQNQIGQHFIAENSASARCGIRPANRALAWRRRWRANRSFQFVDTFKEPPTFTRRQGFDLFQHFIRAHGKTILSTASQSKPGVPVKADVHYGGQPHCVHLIGNVRPRWHKCRRDGRYDLPVAQPGVAQTPLRCVPAIRPFPAIKCVAH